MHSLTYIREILKCRKISGYDRTDLLSVQHQRWMKLLKYVNKNSPYYSEIIRGINLPLVQIKPEHFPLLTKELIEKNFDRIVTDPNIKLKEVIAFSESHSPSDLFLNQYHIMKTSGTTGEPQFFVSTTNEVIKSVAPSVARGLVKKRRSPLKICMLGYKDSYSSSTQNVTICSRIWVAKKLAHFRLISMDQPFEHVLNELNEFQPHIVSGYTKILLLLADSQKVKKLNISPDSIESGGEPLLEQDRLYLKETFNHCLVNNNYGSTEASSMGICRDNENSVELFEDHLIYDLKEDETHITNLHNYTMPLIRYQMTDILKPLPSDQWKPFQRVYCAVGRSNGIHYFTTLENQKIKIHTLEIDPVMPKGVQAFSMSCDKPGSVIYTILLNEKDLSNSSSIIDNTQLVLNDFFSSKGLSGIEIKVVLTTNRQSLKANFGKKSALID